MRKLLTTLLFTMALAFSGMANAIIIAPASANWNGGVAGEYYQDNTAFNAGDVETIVGTTIGSLSLLFKAEAVEADLNDAVYEGSFKDSYTTLFDDNWQGGTISYVPDANTITCPECYLVVKDGNNDPYWYIFNLGSWDGTDDIVLSGFWLDKGSISHVAIYGATATNVPEPSISALLGLGLLGMLGVSRRKTVA